MDRQDSIGSMSSGASGMSGASSAAAEAMGGGGADDLTEKTQTIQTIVFGALMTLFRDRWEDSKRYATGRFLLEHLQLLLILMQAHWLWTIDYGYWLWAIPNYVLLTNLTIPMGYTVFEGVLYAFVAAICATLAASAWISYAFFKNGMVPNKWPVKLLRLLMMIMYQVFYVTILNYLMSPLACNWLDSSAAVKSTNSSFPHRNCLKMPHLAQLAVSATFAVLFIITGGLFALADVTPNPVSQHWLAQAHSCVEVKAWFFKTFIVLCANLLSDIWKVQAVPILIAAGWLAYTYLRWQPYYHGWVNHLRTGLYAMTAYVALMLTINVWLEADDVAAKAPLAARAKRAELLTLLMLVLMPVAFLVGAVASWVRLRLASTAAVKKFREVKQDSLHSMQNLKDIHKFLDQYEVEIIARCCRKWTDYEDKELDATAVKLAEVIIKAGMQRFNHSSHMVLVWVNFLGNVLDNQGSCGSQLLAAKALEPSWCDRFVLFVREQQQMARLQTIGASTESAVDLVGYVEFQRSYKQVLRAHKSALYAQRAFWKVLLHANVSFNEVVHCFKQIELCRTRAERAYKNILERYPTHIKVMRGYARFLEDLKSDPWSASKFYSEADKQEEVEAQAGDNLQITEEIGGGEGSGRVHQVDEKNHAVCVINAQGIIQLANKKLQKMFGYHGKGEMEGKNVSMLMPQPFSGHHNGYLRNYLNTGIAKILDTPREVVGLHKERYVFPISLMVTKVSGQGADAIFMAVLKPSVEDESSVKAWMMPGGTMLCVDARFTDWLGMVSSDCVGKPFTSLALDAEVLQGLMDKAATAKEDDFKNGSISVQDVALSHKYADPQRVNITIELGGTNSQRLLVAVLRKQSKQESDHLMVTDHKGRILYITNKLATLMGAPNTKSLIRTDFARFMAQPFMQLHAKWMKDVPVKVPLSSCRNSAPVVLITQQRTAVPALLDIGVREQGEENVYTVKVHPITFPVALNSRRLSLNIDNHGNILDVSDSPSFLFGFKPSLLVGQNISSCLDVLVGLPETEGQQGLDVSNLLTVMVGKVMQQKDLSWRCGLHPPMTAEEVAAAQANSIQANMLAGRTKPALMQLEVQEADDEHGGVTGITAHLWRSEMLTGVVEVDRDCIIQKAGCCALHMPGPLFGVPSAALLHTPLSKWLNVPASYDGLLLDPSSNKRGALKKNLADVKIGPLKHCTGVHSDGDPVYVALQAVVKEGTGPPRLVVKLTIEKPRKGNMDLARNLLGLTAAATTTAATPAQQQQSMTREALDYGPGDAKPSPKQRGGVKFGGGVAEGSDIGSEYVAEEAGTGHTPRLQAGAAGQKSERLMEWVRQSSHLTGQSANQDGDGYSTAAGGGGLEGDMLPPPSDEGVNGYTLTADRNAAGDDAGSQGSGGDDASSQHSGDEAGGYHSDFKRGKRLRKLVRLLSNKQAQKVSSRFYRHSCIVILALLAVHITCFIATVVLIDSQKQYIQEVDDAGRAVIAFHRMAIDCRVLDALHRGVEYEGIFLKSDLPLFLDLFKEAIDIFQVQHDNTYLGRNKLRRFFNRKKYKLQDYWETPMWNVSDLIDSEPQRLVTRQTGLWELGNEVIAAAREVYSNHERLVASGKPLSESRFWHFVMENAPWSLYSGYKITLYGLVERVLAKIGDVGKATIILLVLEGCLIFLTATAYIALLMHKMVSQRCNLLSVFLVIPAGFLRALASKQVQLDEDAESDGDSEAGDITAQELPDPQQQQQPGAKLNLSLPASKKGKGGPAELGGGGLLGRGAAKPRTMLGKLANALNPLSWFGSGNSGLDTGKKQLVRNSRDVMIMASPFLIWSLVIIMIYVVSYIQLKNVQAPFQMLNMINFLVFRVTRGVLFGLETCMAPNSTMINLRKNQTAVRLHDLKRDYNSFLYGFASLGSAAVRDDLSADAAAIFQNAGLAKIFFKHEGCLRKDPSNCFPPSHKFYGVTHNGLDAMATRFIQETELLLADADNEVNITNIRLEFLWEVGRHDLFEGMDEADRVFRTSVERMFDALRTAHILVFIASMLGSLVLWLALVRPYLKRAGKEARQIAEMLSQLPAEMDIEGLIGQALTGGDLENGKEGAGSLKGSAVPGGGAGGRRASSELIPAGRDVGGYEAGAGRGGRGGGGGGGGFGDTYRGSEASDY